jgi:hypothetical protein
MKRDLQYSVNPPRKVFLKLTLLGGVLVGIAYISLLILNSAMSSMH